MTARLRRQAMRGAALMEFALAWPVALLVVVGCVELSVWGAEAYAARGAALAAARAGSVVGADPRAAANVGLRALEPTLVGVRAAAWCPGQSGSPPEVWVCFNDLGPEVEVTVGGTAPALVAILGGSGLPLHADVVLQKEAFAP